MSARSAGMPGRKSASRTGYYQALMNPKTGPLVGIPTFVPLETQRQRVRAVQSIGTTTGNLTLNVNPRRFCVNDSGAVRWAALDGMTDAEVTAANDIPTNAEHTEADFGNGSDLKARIVALQITVKNVSSLNDRNGMFYGLQERHHHNLAGRNSASFASDEACVIQSATDGDITLLYRPVQPREVEDWQHLSGAYPDELGVTSAGPTDGGPLDQFPGFMSVIWKGSSTTPQTFFVEVDAIVEYAGETKDMVSSEPHSGAPPGCTAAQPRDIPHVVKELQIAEKHPAHHKGIVAQIENAALKGLKWLGHQADPTSSAGKKNWKTAGAYAVSALSKYGKYKKGGFKRATRRRYR
jgi:hypothetical protein